MKILLTGANGMLAADVKITKPNSVSLIETDVDELDITNANAVDNFCKHEKPDLILNCAAYTAVDKAEEDKEIAYAVNTTGPKNLAQTAAKLNIPFVHVSTDYVFFGDGSAPMKENDECDPKGVYAKTKRAGELEIEDAGGKWLTVRTSWLYGLRGNNFPDTMIRLASERDALTVVNDQKGSPTFSRDLAEALWKLIELQKTGYFHFSNSGECTWFDFAVEAIKLAKDFGILPKEKNIDVQPVTSDKFPRPAPRPAYSVMALEKYIQATGETPRSWQDGLRNYLEIKK
jgi:dTDP-4-dehydrorhamnose reductase